MYPNSAADLAVVAEVSVYVSSFQGRDIRWGKKKTSHASAPVPAPSAPERI